MVKTSFIKDDGTLCLLFFIEIFQILQFFFYRVVKELSYIFCPIAFDHTFSRHQGSCSLSWKFEILLF